MWGLVQSCPHIQIFQGDVFFLNNSFLYRADTDGRQTPHSQQSWLRSTDHGACVFELQSMLHEVTPGTDKARPRLAWEPNPQKPPSANRISWKVSRTAPKRLDVFYSWLLRHIFFFSLHNLLLVPKPLHVISVAVNNTFKAPWTASNPYIGWLVDGGGCVSVREGVCSTQVGEQWQAHCLKGMVGWA